MKVKDLIKLLEQYNPEHEVLAFDEMDFVPVVGLEYDEFYDGLIIETE